MLLEAGDLRSFEIEIQNPDMITVREAAQALIIARQRAERAVLEKDEKEFDFLSRNIQGRLKKLVGEVEKNGWMDVVPKQIDLGYVDGADDDMDLPIRAKSIYLTRGPDLVTVREFNHNFFGLKWSNLDKFNPMSPEVEDWFRTDLVDLHLFAAIPDEGKRRDVLTPWFIPEHVRSSLAL